MHLSAKKVQGFKPVRVEILCETQAEVNALYTVANFSQYIANELAGKHSYAGRGMDLPIKAVLDAFYAPLGELIRKE